MTRSYYTIAQVGELEDGKGKLCNVNGEMIALYNKEGQYHAISAVCPHAGSLINTNKLFEGEAVCFHHFFRFKPETGECANFGGFSTQVYELKIEDNEIKALLWDKEGE